MYFEGIACSEGPGGHEKAVSDFVDTLFAAFFASRQKIIEQEELYSTYFCNSAEKFLRGEQTQAMQLVKK